MAIHIKKLLDKFIKEKQADAEYWQRVKQIFDSVLEENLKPHIRPEKICKNTLFVCSDSSSVSYEFNLNKNKVLKTIKQEFPDIKDIKIRLV
jgi:hypothetical protein